jgi:hypothetical protein
MSDPTMRYVYDHGGEIVCAFSKTDRVAGRDIGEIMGAENKGVRIRYSTEAEEVFAETKPDICIVETMALLPDCEDIFMLCAKMGISEDYGIAFAHVHGVNLTPAEFEEKIAKPNNITESTRKGIPEEDFLPCYVWNSNGWLCDKFGWTVKTQEQIFSPQFHGEPLYSDVLGETIQPGNATGLSAKVITTTEEGVIIESECVGKVYAPGEEDLIYWTICGEPDINILLKKPDTVAITCAGVVNRLPDVINAPAGYVTTDKMPVISYRTRPLNEYVNRED